MGRYPTTSPYLPTPPQVPTPGTFARKIDFGLVGTITDVDVFALPLWAGQPYSMTVANLPLQGPGGPGAVEVTVFERLGFETQSRSAFIVGHGQSATITGVGPIRVLCRQRVLTTNPQVDFFVSINPAVSLQIPVLSGIEIVGAAFATVQLQAGFPAANRTNLTVLCDGQIDMQGIDSAGNVIFQNLNLTTYRVLDNCPVRWDPELRLQLRGSGGAPATRASVVWSQ